MKIVLATRNRDKISEIEAILAPLDLDVLTLDAFPGAPEVAEDGRTLEENALKKARAIRDFTGISSLADDSGLEIDALDGAPGVYSSRYAGERATYADNVRKVLQAMAGVREDQRAARFRCVMALSLDGGTRVKLRRALAKEDSVQSPGRAGGDPDSLVTEGILEGRIASSARGSAGFGYDPIFEVPALGKTLAELGSEAKNRVSHRYRALVEMRELLLKWGLARGR